MLTDHRGNDQGSLSVVLTPCTKKGSPLGDDYFVEDPKELLDKGICLILYHLGALLWSIIYGAFSNCTTVRDASNPLQKYRISAENVISQKLLSILIRNHKFYYKYKTLIRFL